jgi:uncharacterized protein (TIGR03663 family)
MRTERTGSRDAARRAVIGVTALALAVRLVALGGRVFHWDEGRVGYWILRYHETGEFYYRPIIHGPFLPVVNDYVFGVLPPTDFSARLVVALVGGLLPLVAWLLRDRLTDAEVVGVALALAANPLLVYYSRFMRSDVLVAGFVLFAFGFAVRALDADDARWFYPAGAALAMGFAAKENALIYLVSFAGAAVLLLDHRMLRRGHADGVAVTVRSWADELGRRLARLGGDGADSRRARAAALGHLAGGVVVFFAVVVFFYAPRPDLWGVAGDPSTALPVLERATVGAWEEFLETWGGAHQDHGYLPYLHDFLDTLLYGAPALLTFAVVGFVADGYGPGDGSRDLVAFLAYVGAVSVVGYPVATDIQAPWATIHTVTPLAVPAGVGLAAVYRTGARSLVADDRIGVALAALLLLTAATGTAGANAAYMNSTEERDKAVLQWAQPGNELRAALLDVRAVAGTNDPGEADVLFYGTTPPGNPDETLFYVANESTLRTSPPGGPAWHSRLPLPWYLERYGATVTSTDPETPAAEALSDPPPVVFAYGWDADEVASHLDGYVASRYRFKLWSEDVVVFVEESALREGDRRPTAVGSDRGD